MSEILIGRASECAFSPETLNRMYRFRYEVFKERLGWEVEARDGEERDHFDELDPVYIMSRDVDGQIVACWRALPTTGPYMLTDTFPQLLAGEDAPHRPDVWELSRFAVQPPRGHDQKAQATSSALTLQMLRAGYLFGADNGISDYVTVASVAMERLLRQIGLPMTRFGDGKARRLGRVLSVAVHIPIGEALRAALFDSKEVDEAVRRVA